MNSLIFGGHNTTLMSMMSQMLSNGMEVYIRDPWNKMDQGMYFVLLLAVILRFALPDEHFIGARYVYTINLVMFYLRILQLYYVNPRLGPKVLIIWRMVCTSSIVSNVDGVEPFRLTLRFFNDVSKAS